jgi:hypothetical protein
VLCDAHHNKCSALLILEHDSDLFHSLQTLKKTLKKIFPHPANLGGKLMICHTAPTYPNHAIL